MSWFINSYFGHLWLLASLHLSHSPSWLEKPAGLGKGRKRKRKAGLGGTHNVQGRRRLSCITGEGEKQVHHWGGRTIDMALPELLHQPLFLGLGKEGEMEQMRKWWAGASDAAVDLFSSLLPSFPIKGAGAAMKANGEKGRLPQVILLLWGSASGGLKEKANSALTAALSDSHQFTHSKCAANLSWHPIYTSERIRSGLLAFDPQAT